MRMLDGFRESRVEFEASATAALVFPGPPAKQQNASKGWRFREASPRREAMAKPADQSC
jgi:hypothetical protein